MKTLSSHKFYDFKIAINAPETHEDFNYLCNLAVAQKMYENVDWTFFKLLDHQRQYIRHLAAVMVDDEMFGLSIIWDFTKRLVDLNKADSEQTLIDFGFLQNAIGVYVPEKYRGGKVGSLIANHTMESFGEPVFAIGNTEDQYWFWASKYVDKTYLPFVITDDYSSKINF